MPYRNLTELQTACQRKQKLKYLFFWGHTPARAGEIDKAVLSQWYPAPFTLDGVRYASAEHYMMAEKAALFADRAAFDAIIASASPGKAKALGRQVADYDDATWQASSAPATSANSGKTRRCKLSSSTAATKSSSKPARKTASGASVSLPATRALPTRGNGRAKTCSALR